MIFTLFKVEEKAKAEAQVNAAVNTLLAF